MMKIVAAAVEPAEAGPHLSGRRQVCPMGIVALAHERNVRMAVAMSPAVLETIFR